MEDDGYVGFDDAWFALGDEDGLELRLGRFEAYDLFPLGQDVLVDYNANTSDSLYLDGEGYVYQVMEGIGPADSALQMMLSYDDDDFRAEVSALFGGRLELFYYETYHGYAIEEDHKDALIVRPVVAWEPGPWTLAAGLETNLVDDALIDENGADISARTGYGISLSYERDDLEVNVNLAYMEGYREEDLTLGVNAVWDDLGIGYIRAMNNIKSANPAAADDNIIAGRYTTDTLYASYAFSDLLDFDDVEIYIGAYYSRVHHEGTTDLDNAESYDSRLQLIYSF